MDRIEIKKLAKEKIRGNKWNIIWPMLVISVVSCILESIVGGNPTFTIDEAGNFVINSVSPAASACTIVISILIGVITAGYMKYILNFVRTGKFDTDDIIECIKKKWKDLLVALALLYVIFFLCGVVFALGIIISLGIATIAFVVLYIIISLAYAMVTFIVIDSGTKGSDSLKASREMMKGYKWDYFVFWLSFIGWCLLVPLTFGIILIWLYPYMTVAGAMYYDELKKLRKKAD